MPRNCGYGLVVTVRFLLEFLAFLSVGSESLAPLIEISPPFGSYSAVCEAALLTTLEPRSSFPGASWFYRSASGTPATSSASSVSKPNSSIVSSSSADDRSASSSHCRNFSISFSRSFLISSSSPSLVSYSLPCSIRFRDRSLRRASVRFSIFFYCTASQYRFSSPDDSTSLRRSVRTWRSTGSRPLFSRYVLLFKLLTVSTMTIKKRRLER